MRYVWGSRYATKNWRTMSTRNRIWPVMSSKKRCSGRPRKNPNSNGVKKEEYTATTSIVCFHSAYHLLSGWMIQRPSSTSRLDRAANRMMTGSKFRFRSASRLPRDDWIPSLTSSTSYSIPAGTSAAVLSPFGDILRPVTNAGDVSTVEIARWNYEFDRGLALFI